MHNQTDAAADQQIEYTKHVLICAIGAAALRAGWTIDTAPGRPLTVCRSDARFEPHVPLTQLADGSMKVDDWKAKCESLGISGVRLAAAAEADKTQARIA